MDANGLLTVIVFIEPRFNPRARDGRELIPFLS